MTEQTKLELIKLNDAQRTALEALVAEPDGAAAIDARVRAALRRKDLLSIADRPTELGRYQVRWYADDCARHWNIETNTWNQYVKRGTAPKAAQRGVFGSSVERPWWRPRDVLDFERPGPGHRRGVHERELDMVTIVREYRGGTSIRKLAKAHGVAAATIAARLEEKGIKRETTATRAARDARMSGNNPTVFPS